MYANALLNITPWRWWSGNAAVSDRVVPTPEVETALQVLRKVLARNERHLGANHFFIHAIEESPFSDSALPMADRFRDLVPAAGHIVHMASHVYQRTGRNALASAANYAAIAADRAYVHQVKPRDPYPLHYLGHNIRFLAWTLSIEGRKSEALNMAEELVDNTTRYARDAYLCTHFPEEITLKSDYFYAAPYYLAVRFQDWEFLDRMEAKVSRGIRDINQTCDEATRDGGRRWAALTKPYSDATLAYARAYRKLAQPLDAAAALEVLSSYWSAIRGTLAANPDLSHGSNRAVSLFRIASLVIINKAQDSTRRSLTLGALQQRIRERLAGSPAQPLSDDVQGVRGTSAEQIIAVWRQAVAVQDSLDYDEPPDWYYTLRESLGYAYLDLGQYGDAERTFLEDLVENRLSGRSLFGLKTSIEKQGRPVPPLLEQQFAEAWRNATVSPKP
jgi:tetratricopeptide (TPR) repeat protein